MLAALKRLVSRPPQRMAAIPEGDLVYAIGDVHGRLDLLKKLWAMIEIDAKGSDSHKTVVFVGDYVDRGPDSKGVIDFLLHLELANSDFVFLRGNHDQSILDFIADSSFYRSWRLFGAPETLVSYGVKPPRFDDDQSFERARQEFVRQCPAEHVKFLQALRHSYSLGDYFFAHAGIRPGIAIEDQDPQDLLWIRDEFLNSKLPSGQVVVHGHTPEEVPKRRTYRIGIDTGAYATGKLTALVLEQTSHRFIST